MPPFAKMRAEAILPLVQLVSQVLPPVLGQAKTLTLAVMAQAAARREKAPAQGLKA